MPRKQASRPEKSKTLSTQHAQSTSKLTKAQTGNENDQFTSRQTFSKGGSFSTRPEKPGSKQNDWRVGAIMIVCLPISLLIFWKITLPVLWWILNSLIGSDLLQKMGFFKQDIISLIMSECPVWIPAEERAFLDDRSLDQILRVSDISVEDFEEIVRRGEPVIVTDALRDWEAFGLYDCSYVMRKFPKAEYFDWQDQQRITLGNITKRSGYTGLQCASGYMETEWEVNQKYAKEWIKRMPPPYFLSENAYIYHPHVANKEPSVTGFLGVPGTGVAPHLDETCDTIMTAQLSGVKNWSVSWPVKDGEKLKWRKPLVFTLYPGEAMFWYVAMRHHTEVIEDCSLSFSFLISAPAPSDYFNQLVRDLSSVSKAERDALFKETEASQLDYIDSCGIAKDDGGKMFIT